MTCASDVQAIEERLGLSHYRKNVYVRLGLFGSWSDSRKISSQSIVRECMGEWSSGKCGAKSCGCVGYL